MRTVLSQLAQAFRPLLVAAIAAFCCTALPMLESPQAAAAGLGAAAPSWLGAPPQSGVSEVNWRRERQKRQMRRKQRQKAHRQHGKGAKHRLIRDHGRKPDQGPKGKHPKGKPHQGHGKPHKPKPPLICIGGKVSKGRCRCGSAQGLVKMRSAVFACAPRGRPGPILPRPFMAAPAAPAAALATSPQPEPVAPPILAAGPLATAPDFVPDQLLVSIASNAPEAVEHQIAQSHGLQLVNRWALNLLATRLLLYRIPDGRSVPSVLEMLRSDLRVSAPQPNYYYRRQAGEQRPASSGAALQYALESLNMPKARKLATGAGVRIAVIDSTIHAGHPDLDGAVAESFDATAGEGGMAGDHGTAIAGIIAARGALDGIAPEAELLGVTAFAASGPAQIETGTTAHILAGIDWALQKRARILNMSFAGPREPLMQRAMAAAAGQGAILVAAAGNGGPDAAPAYPAAYPGVIAVTAIDIAGKLYADANRGAYIDLAAPGVDILAPATGDGHLLRSGTSFAAAHVSGLAALLLERNPKMSPAELHRALTGTARDLGPSGWDAGFGAGAADALAAISLISASVSLR